jgi:hypothetical protein
MTTATATLSAALAHRRSCATGGRGSPARRRLTPIVEWAAVTSLLETLPAGK